ncbi:hypothetical protein ILYODFUR_026525, partial [Ilyodon furcidens]
MLFKQIAVAMTREEPALLCGEQVASAGNDDVVLRQWLCIPLHRRQTSDPEEVKWPGCSASA